MYKLLLCWRYLRTRYIALASIVSVTLGVATMIVVNSVMEGFTHEMQVRIKGVVSDVVFEARSLAGFPDPQYHMREIDRVAGRYIESMTPTVHVPAMLSYQSYGKWVTRPVQLIGIDSATKSSATDFGQYLQHPENRQAFTFDLHQDGYDAFDPQGGENAVRRVGMDTAGMHRREQRTLWQHRLEQQRKDVESLEIPGYPQSENTPVPEARSELAQDEVNNGKPAVAGPTLEPAAESETPTDVQDPFNLVRGEEATEKPWSLDEASEQRTGCVLGIALSSFRRDGEDHFLVLPGDDIKLTFPTAGTPPRAIDDSFTVVDFYESKMSEYDASFVFVPIEKLQDLRGMVDPETGARFVTSIQIKLKDEADGDLVRDKLRAVFPPEFYGIQTWQDKQGPLLAAVNMETAILNVLLFLIIAVAGFGILAIFFMIVVEKTKDIGILKSLGAPGSGILGIFLTYGLSLGIVGSGAGLVMGLLFVTNINWIADMLGRITGQPVFDPSIYYFDKIPTIVEPFTVTWVVVGALIIAVMASVLPAFRAARLHPVEALR